MTGQHREWDDAETDVELIHYTALDETLTEQCTHTQLQETDAAMFSYFENLGVCVKCLHKISREWVAQNAQHARDGELLATVAFTRGFTLGLVLGRIHKP